MSLVCKSTTTSVPALPLPNLRMETDRPVLPQRGFNGKTSVKANCFHFIFIPSVELQTFLFVWKKYLFFV